MSQPTVPPFHGNISFNAQHSPMGAFFSFTCGQFGSRGGFGLQMGRPGNQDLYIGVKNGDRKSDSPIKALPFYQGAESDSAAAFQVEQAADPSQAKPQVTAYTREQIKRHYGWCSDRWVSDDFTFTIYTPFSAIADTGKQDFSLCPAVVAEFTIDNRTGASTKTGVFALRFAEAGVRPITRALGDEYFPPRVGFALRRHVGFAAQMETAEEGTPFPFMRWSPTEALTDVNAFHMLGNTPGVAFEVPAGEKRTLRLALGAYAEGTVTTGVEGRYAYTNYWSSLEAVLGQALDMFDNLVDWATESDEQLLASGLSPDQQFLIAHSTRSYYGSTQLLDVGGEPFWIVNEGEYCMLNTLDLSVDHVFWELKQNPWVVKNLLDSFVRHYSYVDNYGISFSHDMGIHNQFSPKGHSSYELANLDALCFSYMTCEELCNWILIAGCYLHETNDTAWVQHNAHVLDACLSSLLNRGGEAGYVQHDSSRCNGGAEITTYDSLDHSLAQTRNNVYMAVKCWASYLALEKLLAGVDPSRSALAKKTAKLVETNVLKHAGADGVFPAVFEKQNAGYASRILPAIEGLMYPLYWGGIEASPFVDALKKHTLALLKDAEHRNVFDDGGIKLSSTSNNSWMSKIAIFMHVCRRVFKLDQDPQIRALFAKADAAHTAWQTEGESAYWACSDQMVNGVAKGSKYYPRIITSALWME